MPYKQNIHFIYATKNLEQFNKPVIEAITASEFWLKPRTNFYITTT